MTCWNSIVAINFSIHERSHATMNRSTVVALRGKEEVVDPLTELLRVNSQELDRQRIACGGRRHCSQRVAAHAGRA